MDSDAIALAKELDGLPLALSTAGAYLNNVATTFGDYLKMYRDSWLRLHQTTPELVSYQDRALYSTWGVSYTQVSQQNADSAMLLRLWAYFDNEDLWFEMLRQGHRTGPPWFRVLTSDVLGFNSIVRVLCDYGLAEPDASSREHGRESHGYSMHGCFHMWTVHVLNKERDVEMVQLAMRCVEAYVSANTVRDYWTVQRRVMRHAERSLNLQAMSEMLAGEGDEWILHCFGKLFEDQGRLQDAETMYERALLVKERAGRPENNLTLRTLHNLCLLYRDQGRLGDAEAICKRALRSHENALGLEHTSAVLLDVAEAMYERAIRGKEKAFMPGKMSELHTFHNLGNLYADQGQFKNAEAMYQRALRSKEKALGPEHILTLHTVHNLGHLYQTHGWLDNAEAMNNRALEGYERALGLDHKLTLNTVNNLGLLYTNRRRLEDAEVMYERALRGKEKALGPEHMSTLYTINNLGNLYANQGRLAEAEAMYEQAIQGYEEALGPEQVNRYIPALNAKQNLADLYIKL